MQTVNVSGLQSNPSKSHKGVVVVLHREKPYALMVWIDLTGVLDTSRLGQ